MNFSRLAAGAITAWIVDIAYGFLVYGYLMRDVSRQHAAVFRPEDQVSLPVGFAASFVGFFVFGYVYAKGYEGGSGVQEGLRFGVLIGLLLVCFAIIWNYATLPLSAAYTLYSAIATMIEFVLAGIVVGVLYKPAGRSRR